MSTVTVLVTSPYDGYQLAVCDGMLYYLTPCCGADATGVQHGTACRGCYQLIESYWGDAAMVNDEGGLERMLSRLIPPSQMPTVLPKVTAMLAAAA